MNHYQKLRLELQGRPRKWLVTGAAGFIGSHLVEALLDAGHAYRGGAEVPEFLRNHYRRIIGLHLRDYHDGKQVPLGEGSFPLADVAGTLEQLRWQGWVLNEEEREDGTKLGRSVMETSFAAMKKVFSQ